MKKVWKYNYKPRSIPFSDSLQLPRFCRECVHYRYKATHMYEYGKSEGYIYCSKYSSAEIEQFDMLGNKTTTQNFIEPLTARNDKNLCGKEGHGYEPRISRVNRIAQFVYRLCGKVYTDGCRPGK